MGHPVPQGAHPDLNHFVGFPYFSVCLVARTLATTTPRKFPKVGLKSALLPSMVTLLTSYSSLRRRPLSLVPSPPLRSMTWVSRGTCRQEVEGRPIAQQAQACGDRRLTPLAGD